MRTQVITNLSVPDSSPRSSSSSLPFVVHGLSLIDLAPPPSGVVHVCLVVIQIGGRR